MLRKSILIIHAAVILQNFHFLEVTFHLVSSWEKNSSGQQFSDFQVTGAIVIPIFGEVPAYPFIGFTFGSRNYKNDTNQTYVDMQISVWSFVTAGIGTGYLITNGSVQKRQKWWGGVSFIPIILTRDKVYLDDEHILSRGGMLVLPLPKFGNSFYP